MGTANFKLNKYIDNYVYISNEYDNDLQDYDYDFRIHRIDILLKQINENQMKNIKSLDIFKLEICSGYYDGIIIKLALQGLDDLSADWILSDTFNNDDSKYYFGECKSIVQRKARAEVNRINKKILPLLAKHTGLLKVRQVGVFSNGEQIIEVV